MATHSQAICFFLITKVFAFFEPGQDDQSLVTLIFFYRLFTFLYDKRGNSLGESHQSLEFSSMQQIDVFRVRLLVGLRIPKETLIFCLKIPSIHQLYLKGVDTIAIENGEL